MSEEYGEKSEKKESKEKMKTPELEKDNHKIDKELSVDEKLKKGWKKEKTTAYINWTEKKVTVLKKQIEGSQKDAFVREYLDDGVMPKHLVWEQLFNRYAVLNLWLEKRLPSYEQMETIRWGQENHSKFLKDNFQKNGENIFPGYRHPHTKTFNNVGTRTDCWLSGGHNIGIHKDDMSHDNTHHNYGFSLRFLKN